MNEKQKQDIALMRYSIISPLITETAREKSLAAFFRQAAEKKHPHPDGSMRLYAAPTIEKWYRAYKHHGFDGLLPCGRSDAGTSRKIDEDTAMHIRYLKETYPRMSAASIYRQLQSDGIIAFGQLSESTVCRYVRQLEKESSPLPQAQMRRYERAHINEVWCGDSCTGPYLKTADGKKKRVCIIALIDDASRFITGAGIFFNDTFVNLLSVIKSAVSKYGRPKLFNFDNGSAYKNKQMELLAARIGSALNYCQPYTPTSKAKIERWFRTLKDQWMAELDMNSIKDLDTLRKSFFSYVHEYNLRIHSSLNGKSPQDRFFSEPEHITRLDEDTLQKAFLLQIERRVSADSVVIIDHKEYEVDFRFAKRRICLRYSADLSEIYVVEADGSLSPIRLLNRTENAISKREKFRLAGGDQ